MTYNEEEKKLINRNRPRNTKMIELATMSFK